jgi:hypothetical protein
VIVGISAVLHKQQVFGSAPTTISYSIFTGVFGMVVALLNIVPLFVTRIPALVPMVVDAIAALLLLAGGIAWAVGLKGVKCAAAYYNKLHDNHLINEGCDKTFNGCGVDYRHQGEKDATKFAQEVLSTMKSRCHSGRADEIIQFVAFAVAFLLVGWGFFLWRKQKSGSLGSGRRGFA